MALFVPIAVLSIMLTIYRRIWKCADCREQFSVLVGTIFEDSKIPLSKWLLAIHLLCQGKNGVSAHELHRTLGITYKSAWFMTHRIRYAMERELLASAGSRKLLCKERKAVSLSK